MAKVSGTYDPQKVEITIGRPTSADGSELLAIEPFSSQQSFSEPLLVSFMRALPTVSHDHGAPHVHDVYSNGTLGPPRYT